MPSEHYDAVVLGAGQGGDPLAREWAKAGRGTAIVERAAVGGNCVNWGCTPTKTLVESARVAHLARRAKAYGIEAGPVSADFPAVMARMRRIVEDARSGIEKSYAAIPNLDLIMGEARFTGPKRIEVRLNAPGGGTEGSGGTRTLTADQVFINTGLHPTVPPVPGLSDVPALDSVSILGLDALPEHLVILGGGYVALEYGQMFRRFGSRVTMIERGDRLMSREDAEVSDALAEILRGEGIEILLGHEAERVRRAGDGIEVFSRAKGASEATKTIGSHLLVAVGRTPNTEGLGLETAGVVTDEKGYVTVNDRLETNVPGVYALGDVNGGPAFTHISYDDFRVLRANLLEGKSASVKDRLVPYVAFTDPQLGRIGVTEHEARAKGLEVRAARLPMTRTARGTETGETLGFLQAVVDAKDGRILGAAVLAREGGEIMAVLEVAMMGGLPYTALKDGVFAHPTLAESLNNLFMTLDG
jgi:pyruvate/2-oxoglutarate dehydrogenase complex dihydrolipoamide dehydrogenase (E3) component